MTFPTTLIPITNLDNGADDPSLARADLLLALQTINTILETANTSFGVAVLQSDGTIDPTKLPATLAPTGQLTLSPSNTIVKIQNILRLQQIPASVLVGLTATAGDVALCSDIDAGGVAICIYDGTVWKYTPKASMSTVV